MFRIFGGSTTRRYPLGGYVSGIEFCQKRWEIGRARNRLLPKSFAFSGEKNPPLSARYSNYRTSYLYHATCHTFAFPPLTFSIRSALSLRRSGMGKVPKVTLMIQCKVDGIWKKLPAQFQENPGTTI
jgi:hypothetical protein